MTNAKQPVIFRDLGGLSFRQAWDYQEELLQQNVKVKAEARSRMSDVGSLPAGQAGTMYELAVAEPKSQNSEPETQNPEPGTQHYLLFVEHPPVYTLGKSGSLDNLLINEEQLANKGIEFFKINRGGDITFHGPQQL